MQNMISMLSFSSQYAKLLLFDQARIIQKSLQGVDLSRAVFG